MAQNIAFDVIARDKASATFSRISRSSKESEGHLKKYGERLLALGGLAFGGAEIVSFFKESATEARTAQKATALTSQVIKTTGGAARVSAKQVAELADAIEHKSTVDHLQIQSSENLLLTFRNVRNEAGKGNRIFNQATQAAVDLGAGLAAASGGQIDFRSATTLVGKALNDPIKGLTALRRVGVAFSKTQQDQIKKLVASGHLMKAQKVILRELKAEFGGAAKSQATAGEKARLEWKRLQEQIGTSLLPVVDNLATKIADDVVPAISKFVKQMQDGKGKGGELAHTLKDMVDAGKGVFGFFNGLPAPIKKYGAELAVALVVMNKFGPGLGRMAGAFTLSAAQMEAGVTRTGLAMTRLKTSAGALAGAAGMVAIVDGAKRSNHALGALEVTAGAAAVGFQVGGPLGAGIAGAGAGLFELGKWAYSSGKAAQDTLPGWKDYASTLDGVTAATTKATRAMVLEDLQKTGVLKQTQALNISDRDAVQASMGNAAARKRVSAALADATVKGKGYQALQVANHLGDETLAVNDSRVAYLQKNLALAATKQEAAKIQAKLDKLGRTNSTPNIHIKGAQRAINQLTTINRLMLDATHAKGGGTGAGGGNASPPRPGSVLGGLSTTSRTSAGGTSAPQFYIDKVITPNVDAFLGDMQKRSKLSGLDGRRRR